MNFLSATAQYGKPSMNNGCGMSIMLFATDDIAVLSTEVTVAMYPRMSMVILGCITAGIFASGFCQRWWHCHDSVLTAAKTVAMTVSLHLINASTYFNVTSHTTMTVAKHPSVAGSLPRNFGPHRLPQHFRLTDFPRNPHPPFYMCPFENSHICKSAFYRRPSRFYVDIFSGQ